MVQHDPAGGQLMVLQWCRSNKCPWCNGNIAAAAEQGRQEIVSWVEGYPEDGKQLEMASWKTASKGQKDTMKYLVIRSTVYDIRYSRGRSLEGC